MGTVWEAMKRHQAEQQAGASSPAEAPPGAPPAPGQPRPAEPPRRGPATVARANGDGYSPLLLTHHDRGGKVAEEYRTLRTNLLARSPDQRLCYMITSAVAGEGKTVTCLNLALVMAERQDCRTVVVDCDLRKRKMAAMLNVKPAPGIADVLRGKARLSDVTSPTAYQNLWLVPAGQARAEELGELLVRPELSEAMAELRSSYDHVLLDTPPINVVSESGVIGRVAGEAILVVRMNSTHRESVQKAIRLLHAASVRVAGIVLTHRQYHIPGYLYRYS